MKKTLLCAAILLCGAAWQPVPDNDPQEYLRWMQQSLMDVPEWTAWQQSTGELPPDFDRLPRSNLLPDPLRFLNGSPVNNSAEDWEARRVEIRRLFETYMTGTFPPKPPIDRVVPLDETSGEGYTVRNVRVEFGPQSRGSVRIQLVIPDGATGEKFPVLISPNLAGWGSRLIRRGYISAGYAGNDFMDDAESLKDLYPDYDFARLPRRAWLARIVLDYLETVPQVDMNCVGIYGYSRDGKMATIAAAFDERITALIAGSTGVGGVVPWRLAGERGGGESIESTTRMFPSWFVPRLRFFSGREDYLPVDANLFLALIAPRAALLVWGLNDQVANGWGMEQAAISAQKVYERLGQPIRMDLMPLPGFHGANDADACIDWLDWQFGRTSKKWESKYIFPWDFEQWQSLSGEKINPGEYPEYDPSAPPARSLSEWNARVPGLLQSVDLMLGDTPPTMPTASGGFYMRRRQPPGPTEVAKGNTGNPGQLAPDVPSWVIAAGGQEYGWREPEKNQVESRRIRFGSGITGDLYYPAGTPEGTELPTVIWLHGFHHPLGYMWVYRRDLHPILALTRSGYAVLAYDQSGYGTRFSEAAPFYDRFPHWSRLGKMVEDLGGAVDALQAEALVDSTNISVFGFTLGGTLGLYAAALDERITGVVSICGFTPMRTDTPDRGLSGMTRWSHQHGLMPRLGLFAGNESRLPYDYDDIISLIAPRPVLIVQPLRDRDASPDDVRSAVERARSVYSLKGAPGNLGLQEPDDYGRLTTSTQDRIIEWMQMNIKNQ
jgi:pimeloyl-ACP methyl ester carboxylesterase